MKPVYILLVSKPVSHRIKVAVGTGGRVNNAVGTIFRKICVGTRARPI